MTFESGTGILLDFNEATDTITFAGDDYVSKTYVDEKIAELLILIQQLQ